MPKKNVKSSILSKLRNYFIAGVVVLIPIGITLYLTLFIINLSSKKKEIELKYDLERNVKLIKFSEGKIDIEFNENLGKNFVRNLSERLLGWTGRRWVISLTKEKGQKTFLEQKNIKKKELLEKEKNSEVHQKFKDIFSDLELIEVKKEKED